MDLSTTVTPKGQQLNADDLIAGPRTIEITAVEKHTAEQPVAVRFKGDENRPYLPSKGMRRVLLAIWGKDGSAYVGRRLTLYCDKTVTFGPDTTGGIRISHASHITERMEIALTVKRGKRKPFFVEPLPAEEVVDIQALSDVGDTKAREGLAALRAWFTSLPTSAQKQLRPKLDSEWKPTAEAVKPTA